MDPRRISPASGASSPLTTSKSVVFPAPFGPMRPVMLPSPTPKLTPSRAWRPPKRFLTPKTARSWSRAGPLTRGSDVGAVLDGHSELAGGAAAVARAAEERAAVDRDGAAEQDDLGPAVHLPAVPRAVVGSVQVARPEGPPHGGVEHDEVRVAAHGDGAFLRIQAEDLRGVARRHLDEALEGHAPPGHALRVDDGHARLHAHVAAGGVGDVAAAHLDRARRA